MQKNKPLDAKSFQASKGSLILFETVVPNTTASIYTRVQLRKLSKAVLSEGTNLDN